MGQSNISYLDYVWNPYTQNCTPVSPGCKNCYAREMQERFGKTFVGVPTWRKAGDDQFYKIPSGVVCGVNFLSDTWHEKVKLGIIAHIHRLIMSRPDVQFIYTTKRADRLGLNDDLLPWPENLWVGVSIELADQLWRLDYLRRSNAVHRWVSFEPLLGPIGNQFNVDGIEWIVTGAESGKERRHFSPEWAVDIGHRAQTKNIPFYHKQGSHLYPDREHELWGKVYRDVPVAFNMIRKAGPEPGLVQQALWE